MEIQPNNRVDPVVPLPVSQPQARVLRTGTDISTFDRAQALEEALQATPEVRPGVVEYARPLIGDVAYPPAETIHRIAVLFAMNLDSPEAPSSE